MKLLGKLSLPNWVLLFVVIGFLSRIPSFFEPFYYGDEMIYLTLGVAIRKGLTLYQHVHDNKPPFLYYTAALAGNVYWFRVILAIWMSATTIFFWKFTNWVFAKEKFASKLATGIFVLLTSIPLFEGQIANAELFLLAPVIIAMSLATSKKITLLSSMTIGFMIAIATLFKVPAIFEIIAISFFLFVQVFRKNISFGRLVMLGFAMAIGLIIPIAITFVWYWSRGALSIYIQAAFLENLGYVSSWRASSAPAVPFLVKNLPLITRGIMMLVGLLVLLLARNKLSLQFLLVAAWMITGLFAITLSERPYPHYVIQAVPAIAILITMLFTRKNIEQSLSIIPLFFLGVALVYYQFWYYPTLSYYSRFFKFATGQTNKQEYFQAFDSKTNRNYKVAHFILTSTNSDDRVFVWGDSATIYALSRRLPPFKYVAGYHISDYSSIDQTIMALSENKPELIILQPEDTIPLDLLLFIRANYIPIEAIDDVRIWKLLQSKTQV